jgi:hypothetical protein
MLYSLGQSAQTIAKLAEFPWFHTRDSYAVSRSFLELAVNICFIVARGTDAAERALRHTRQKAFRDLDRQSKVGEDFIRIFCSRIPDPVNVDGLPEALADFTTARGAERHLWVEDSIDDRIATVGQLDPLVLSDLHMARFIVYRHASEVLHGTHFGVHHCFGLTDPTRQDDPSTLMERLGDQQVLLLLACSLAASAVARSFHAAYGCVHAETTRAKLFDLTLDAVELYASRGKVRSNGRNTPDGS